MDPSRKTRSGIIPNKLEVGTKIYYPNYWINFSWTIKTGIITKIDMDNINKYPQVFVDDGRWISPNEIYTDLEKCKQHTMKKIQTEINRCTRRIRDFTATLKKNEKDLKFVESFKEE